MYRGKSRLQLAQETYAIVFMEVANSDDCEEAQQYLLTEEGYLFTMAYINLMWACYAKEWHLTDGCGKYETPQARGEAEVRLFDLYEDDNVQNKYFAEVLPKLIFKAINDDIFG